MLSAIQILRHAFSRAEILCLPPNGAKSGEENYEIRLGLSEPKYDEAKDAWNLVLDVRFGPGKDTDEVRYKGHFTVAGSFRIREEFNPDLRVSMVRMNGGSLLLGAVRELVSILTARSTRGPMELVTFDARTFLKDSPPPEVPESPKLEAPGEA